MTAKNFVKTIYPEAEAEFSEKYSYWLIDTKKEYCFIAYGRTQMEAWEKAKERLIKKVHEKPLH